MLRAAALLAMLIAVSPALAQGAPPPSPPAQAAPRLSEDQRARLRADRDACRAEVKPKDLPRAERRGAMRRCIEARNPDAKPLFARGEARRAELRQLRDACRDELRGKNVRGPERRLAMRSCMVSRKPELAKVFGCMNEARAKNLQPGAERRVFMRTCLRA